MPPTPAAAPTICWPSATPSQFVDVATYNIQQKSPPPGLVKIMTK
jgi:hypothetical protein